MAPVDGCRRCIFCACFCPRLPLFAPFLVRWLLWHRQRQRRRRRRRLWLLLTASFLLPFLLLIHTTRPFFACVFVCVCVCFKCGSLAEHNVCLFALFFFIFKYCVNFALLPTFIFAAFCLLLLEVRRLEQLSHLLVASKPVFAFLTLCMCDCCVRVYVFVCCQLCLVAALIVFVRCPRLLHCNDPPPSTASSFVLTFALLVFVVIEHKPCRALFHTHTHTHSLSRYAGALKLPF